MCNGGVSRGVYTYNLLGTKFALEHDTKHELC